MRDSKKIVFIFGAGASRSISDQVPIMNDFFQKAAEYLQKPKEYPAFWLVFIMLEKYRLFQAPNPYLENLAMFILRDHGHMLNISRSGGVGEPKNTETEEYKRIENEWFECIELYYKGIIQDQLRCKSNLEIIFSMAEEQLYKNKEDDAFVRLLYAINSIFCELRKEFPDSILHSKLATIYKKWLNKNSISAISFNYDIWLERALQKAGLWSPRNGHGITLDKFIDIRLARESHQQDETIIREGSGSIRDYQVCETEIGESRTTILKPHGSLSWYYNEKLNDYLILLDKKDNNMVVDNEGRWWINNIRGTEDFDLYGYEPLLIPPTQIKRRHHSIFWRIDNRANEILSSADLIVIIGWSMPETDIDYIHKIKHIFEHRSDQLQRLIVCDVKKDNTIYFNFESIFKPAFPIIIHSTGFDDEFLNRLDGLEI